MKNNKMINQKDLRTILKHAHDLPSLENKLYGLANNVIDLEIKKKEANAQLFDLGQAITQYQNIIDSKKLQLMKMDKQLAIQRGKSNLDKVLELDRLHINTLVHIIIMPIKHDI